MSRSTLDRIMIAVSARLNYERALRFPATARFIMMTEFPRSGGNWIRDMLGDALQLPVPRFSTCPISFESIVHNHDHRVLERVRSIYVYRDGRDVFLSHFHKSVTTVERSPALVRRRVLRLHPSLRPLLEGADRSAVDLERFYAEWKGRAVGSRVNWGRHVGPWLTARPPATVFVRYEDMRTRPYETLALAAGTLNGGPIRDAVIRFAVDRNSFEAQTGREAGVTDNSSTKRQGLVRGWERDLDPAIATQFTRDFGDVLQLAGYEPA